MRNHKFTEGEYYHIYNRGTEKRDIILDQYDLHRFMKSLIEFNRIEPIGSLYELSFQELGSRSTKLKKNKLVSIIAYCINTNHFHLILTPLVEKGIEKFMQRMAGYTRYFNEKNKRTGVLFQGKFKSKHVGYNNYLNHLSAYVNMNNLDKLGSRSTKLSRSSLEEYIDVNFGGGICDTSIVLDQFKSKKDYLKFAKESWADTLERKKYLEI